MVFISLLNFSFYAVRQERTSDGQGGWSIGFVALPNIQGRLRPANAREREIAAQEQRVITHIFYCQTTADLGRGDYLSPAEIIIDGADLRAADIIVQVEGIREPSTAGEHFEIDCIEYQFAASEFATAYRLLESGAVRLLEDDVSFRLLES